MSRPPKSLPRKSHSRSANWLDRLVRKWGSFEVRLNADKTIDEIFCSGVLNVHLEQMDSGCWWLGISRSDGQMLRVFLMTKHNATISCNAASDDNVISEGFGKFSDKLKEKVNGGSASAQEQENS